MAPFAVVIISHNTCDLLRRCLKSVQPEQPEECIVVDNASLDDSAAMVAAEYPSVRLYRNEANRGYGAAVNQAATASRAPYLLILNSDTRLAPGALTALGQYLDKHPLAAILGPRLLNTDGSLQRSCFPLPTLLDSFLNMTRLGQLMTSVPTLRNAYLRTWPHTSARCVPWLSGAALAVRREAFETVGGFDESFFLYYEEADLCLRVTTAGWQIHFAPVTQVVHVGGASAAQRRADTNVQRYASLMHFYHLHYSWTSCAILVGLVRCVVTARLLRDLIARPFTRDRAQQDDLTADLASWRHLLLERWWRAGASHDQA